MASYEPYKVGDKEDLSTYWCAIPISYSGLDIEKPKGLCQFCNPKSKLWNKKNNNQK
jgi:hypothetical protein